jgi:hypothetical protein
LVLDDAVAITPPLPGMVTEFGGVPPYAVNGVQAPHCRPSLVRT